jgi:hypothetical protein
MTAIYVTLAVMAALAGLIVKFARDVDAATREDPAADAAPPDEMTQACEAGSCRCGECCWLDDFGVMTERAISGRVRWIGDR